MRTTSITDRVRRGVRGLVRSVRSDNRLVSSWIIGAPATLEHRRHPVELGPVAQQAASSLASSGVAMTSVTELLGGTELFESVSARSEELRAGPLEVDKMKPFLTELLGESPELVETEPVLALARHPQVRGVAEAYCGMRLQVQDVNVWVNRPVTGGPVASQRWHRDLPEDYKIVKCFVYLSDVTPGAGALQYVKGSNTSRGRRVRLTRDFDGVGYRLREDEVLDRFGREQVLTATGPRGTVLFADTRGVHRGGHARDAERVVAQITYASHACSRPRSLRAAPGADVASMRDVRLVASR